MRLGDLRGSYGEARWVTAMIGGHSLHAQYLPSGVTPRFVQGLADAARCGEVNTPEMLMQVLVGWDLLGDDGLPFMIARENLEELPYHALQAILSAIIEDFTGPYQKER